MKKAVKYILVVLVIVSMLGTMAMAVNANAAKQYSAYVNGEWTITRAESARLNAMIDAANLKILILVKIAQLTPWNDVKWLLAQVDAIIADVKDYAASIGVAVGCVYTDYYIDGQWVSIDPVIYLPIKIWP
jgi:hypothetical protein